MSELVFVWYRILKDLSVTPLPQNPKFEFASKSEFLPSCIPSIYENFPDRYTVNYVSGFFDFLELVEFVFHCSTVSGIYCFEFINCRFVIF